MSTTAEIIPLERIQGRILVVRGQRVLLDRDLAELYGVEVRSLNQAVKRNAAKFPEDFVFQLTADEVGAVMKSRSQTVILKRGQNLKFLPHAFTEHGAIQAANVLSSTTAVQMSVQVVRAFIGLRQLMVNHKALAAKLAELESRLSTHDEQLAAIVEAIRELAIPVESYQRHKIGYHQGNR